MFVRKRFMGLGVFKALLAFQDKRLDVQTFSGYFF